MAAKIIGTKSQFPSVEVGISNRVNGNEGTTLHYLSHNGPDSANPLESVMIFMAPPQIARVLLSESVS